MINMVEALREAEAYKDHASRYMEYAVEHGALQSTLHISMVRVIDDPLCVEGRVKAIEVQLRIVGLVTD